MSFVAFLFTIDLVKFMEKQFFFDNYNNKYFDKKNDNYTGLIIYIKIVLPIFSIIFRYYSRLQNFFNL